MTFPISETQLLAIAFIVLAALWVAFQLGRFHAEDRRRYRAAVAADREHGRKMARALSGSVRTPVPVVPIRIDEARGLRGRRLA